MDLLYVNDQLATRSASSSVFDFPVHRRGSTLDTSNRPIYASAHLGAPPSSNRYSFVLVSGGTGGNAICSAFGQDTCHVLPVSDDGGSSSEIIRVLGGPSIGDIRSRLIRLIPPCSRDSPLCAIKLLLAHRLPTQYTEHDARLEWRDIVEGTSSLWSGIPADRKETIRSFLVYFETQVLQRSHKRFSFRNGSIGNYFLAAAQDFFRSLPSAIFLFSSITNSQAHILPAIITSHTVTIAAELESGAMVVGQCAISHPAITLPTSHTTEEHEGDGLEYGPRLTVGQNLVFSKFDEEHRNYAAAELDSPISRIYYINAYGHEVHPSPNPSFLAELSAKHALVYSCGSLWTSIMPCLALKGVGDAIARSPSLSRKILLLNSKNDRETRRYSATTYIEVICRTLRSHGQVSNLPVSAFITHLVYLRSSAIEVDERQITDMGVNLICVESSAVEYDASILQSTFSRIFEES